MMLIELPCSKPWIRCAPLSQPGVEGLHIWWRGEARVSDTPQALVSAA
jgi:hypothetical protein